MGTREEWGGTSRSLPGPAGSQVVVLGGGGRRGDRKLCMTLRVVADSIEKSVVALRQLLAEVW